MVGYALLMGANDVRPRRSPTARQLRRADGNQDQETPIQLLLDQEFPDHELPLQLLPLQEFPDQEFPLQEFPDHELPLDNPLQWWRYVPGANWKHPLER